MMHNNTAMLRILVVLVAFVPGRVLAAEEPAKEFSHAVAFRGTTQEDAPALEIYLSRVPYSGTGEPARPYLHIEVAWQEWGLLIGKDLALVPLSRQGLDPSKPIVRAEIALEQEKPTWLKGTLRLKSVKVGEQVKGCYQFADSAGRRWVGKFEAQWVTPKKQE